MINNNVFTLESSYFSLLNGVTYNANDVESLLSFIVLFEQKKDDFLYGLIYNYTDYIINKATNVDELDNLNSFYIKLCNMSKLGKQLGDYAIPKIKIMKDKCLNIDKKNYKDIVITSPYFSIKCFDKNNLFLSKKCDLISEKLGIMKNDYNDVINTFYSALSECKSMDDISVLKNHINRLASIDEKGEQFKKLIYDQITLENGQKIRQNIFDIQKKDDIELFEEYYKEYLKIISEDIYDEKIIDELVNKFLSLNIHNKRESINNVINHLCTLKSNLNEVSIVKGI